MEALKYLFAVVGIYVVTIFLISAMLTEARVHPEMWWAIVIVLTGVGYFTWLLRRGSR